MTQTLATRSVSSRVMTITPAQAITMLEGNKSNRPLSQHTVNKLARIIEEGRWLLNGDSIKITKSGLIIDGQHRLWACIQSNQPIVTLVVEGLEDEAYASLGDQKSRSNADIFAYYGIPRYALASAITGGLWYHAHGKMSVWAKSTGGPDKGELLSAYWQNQQEVDASAIPAESMGKLLEGRIAGTLWILFGRKNPDFRDLFFQRLSAGIGLNDRMAVYWLRRKLEANALSTAHKLPTDYKAMLTIKAWNYRDRPVRTSRGLKVDPSEPFPEIL